MTEPVLAWHWLRAHRRMQYGDLQFVEAGKTYTVEPPVELCIRGLHGSIRPIDTLEFAPGPIICRVEMSGEIIHGKDKLAATSRRVLWMEDASETLDHFACDVAEEALLREREKGREPDPRSWKTIEIKRLHIAGKATDEELSAAWSAARSAAWSAAKLAAESAAKLAAWSAARSAAESAAWSAARDAQNERLERMLLALAPKEAVK